MLGKDQEPPDTLGGLENASGFMRKELGKRIHIRSMPQLHFKFDESLVRGGKMTSLINSAIEADNKSKPEPFDS